MSKEVVIPKETAVFRLDKNGRWVNRHGPFEHKKIIDYFHRAIRKDTDGYHLYQSNGEVSEKVYFEYEDTALFVFDIIFSAKDNDITLMLNTGEKIPLEPEKLFVKDDSLYMETEQDLIKFSERALSLLSRHLDYENDRYFLKIGDKRFELEKRFS